MKVFSAATALADSIGYIYLSEFGINNPRPTIAALDSALAYFDGARAMILDIRDNRGGSDLTGQLILNRFADARRHYMSMKARALASHESFLPPVEWYMQPATDARRFTGPVAVLTNRRSISAADNFILGARLLPQVTIVGDVTAGAFADVNRETLPNGWKLDFPLNTTVDARGTCWEGAGLPPDVWIVNEPAAVAAGSDRVLTLARGLLAAKHAP